MLVTGTVFFLAGLCVIFVNLYVIIVNNIWCTTHGDLVEVSDDVDTISHPIYDDLLYSNVVVPYIPEKQLTYSYVVNKKTRKIIYTIPSNKQYPTNNIVMKYNLGNPSVAYVVGLPKAKQDTYDSFVFCWIFDD